jgi:hypothetical protein
MDWPVVLVGKFKGKNPFGRSRHTWEYNTKVDVKQMGWKGVDWLRTGTSGRVL